MSDTAVSVRGLCKTFGDREVVHGIDLVVEKGEILAFVGPNGSGKTTTIRMLCGLLTPDGGNGQCLGFNIISDYGEIKRHTGYMSQDFSLYSDLTVRENLRFAARIHQLEAINARVNATLDTFDLERYADDLAASLSGGWKQRLSLACALIHKPKLLLLDEPTGGVDPESRRSFWRIIRKQAEAGMSVLVSTHYLDEVELYCDRLTYIHSGDILVTGTVPEIISEIDLAAFRLPVLKNELLARLRGEDAVSMAEVISGGVMITGPDADALQSLFAQYGLKDSEQVSPGLEDIFYFLARSKRGHSQPENRRHG